MNVGQAIKMAFSSLRSNRMRSFLTMLGVIIGVVAVALLTTVTQSAKDYVVGTLQKESQIVLLQIMNSKKNLDEETLEKVAQNMIDSEAGEFEYTFVYTNMLSVNRDALIIKAIKPDDVKPGQERLAETFVRDIPVKSTINVVPLNYAEVRNIEIVGEFLSQENYKTCVVDEDFVKAYFGEDEKIENVLGKTVILGGDPVQSIVTITLASNAIPANDEESLAMKKIALETEAKAIYSKLIEGLTFAYNLEDFDEEMLIITGEGLDVVYTLQFELPVTAYFTDQGLENKINGFFDSSGVTNNATVIASGEFVGGEEFAIVGAIKSESNIFNMTVGMDEIKNAYTDNFEMQILFESMKRSQPVGNVYVLNVSENMAFVQDKDGDNFGIESVFFKFIDEKDVKDGAGKIMIAMIDEDFRIGTFAVISMQAVSAIIGDIINIMSLLLGVIAGISLVVGGIGIMNIMLVVVSERTREIGIRKAIGAKRSSILTQFLIESIVITLSGGLIGLVISTVAALVIGAFMGMVIFIPWWVVLLSLGFCALIGILFGMYPAVKASKLHPIEALRRE